MTHNMLKISNPSPSNAIPAQMNLGIRWMPLLLLALGLLVAFLLLLLNGSVSIPLPEIINVLLGQEASRSTWQTIILQVRLPKATTAILAGSALGISGLMMQTLFRNPLADPFILGTSSGASLGVALVVMSIGTVGGGILAGFGLLGDTALIIAAGTGAGITLLLVLALAQRIQSTMTLLIVGLMVGYLTSAIVSLLMYFTIPERIQSFIQWSFGTFGGTSWNQLVLFAPVIIVGCLASFLLAKPLNALLLGETYATSLGVNVAIVRRLIIIITALLSGAVTAFCGPIGFIGVAVPHLARAILGTSDHRALIPAVVLMGGIVAIIAALIAELPGSQIILPLNAVTSLIGAPIVIVILLRRGMRGQ